MDERTCESCKSFVMKPDCDGVDFVCELKNRPRRKDAKICKDYVPILNEPRNYAVTLNGKTLVTMTDYLGIHPGYAMYLMIQKLQEERE